MKTLIFIHGGESFKKEEDYKKFLTDTYVDWQSEPWTPELKSSWTQEIAKKWYSEWNQVFMPVFPNKLNARYDEWKIVFEWILEKLEPQSEITLIWWSLWGNFLLKYFSEEWNKKILQKKLSIHLIAACQECWDFTPPTNYKFLQELGNWVYIWHAEDDNVVPFSVGQELAEILPEAQTHFFLPEKWYGHFYGIERFPELESLFCS